MANQELGIPKQNPIAGVAVALRGATTHLSGMREGGFFGVPMPPEKKRTPKTRLTYFYLQNDSRRYFVSVPVTVPVTSWQGRN